MHLCHNFFESVLSQSGVDPRVDHGDKIPQGPGWEKAAQVHRHGNFYRSELQMPFTLLLLHQGIEQNRIQIFGNGSIIAFRYLHHLRHRHNAVYNVQRIERFLRPPDTIGLLSRPGWTDFGVGIFHISIFQLSRVRDPQNVQYEPSIFNL